MKFISLSLLALCSVSQAFGSVAGSSMNDDISLESHIWAEYLNDNNIPGQPDNYMTAALRAGAWHDGLAFGVDYRILTDKKRHHRTDQLAGSVSDEIYRDENTFVNVGIGMIDIKDLGGDKVQNKWHKHIKAKKLHMHYENIHYQSVMGVVNFRHVVPLTNDTGLVVDGSGSAHRRGGDVEVRALLSYNNSIGLHDEVNHIDCTSSFSAWVGPGILWHYGSDISPVLSKVNDCYSGLAVNAGLKMEAVTLELQVTAEAAYGSIGFDF